jgi:hypothetical protein
MAGSIAGGIDAGSRPDYEPPISLRRLWWLGPLGRVCQVVEKSERVIVPHVITESGSPIRLDELS